MIGTLVVLSLLSGLDAPERVLFVGNSYTFYNGGVDAHVQEMVLENDPGAQISTIARTVGGYTLEDHSNDATTRDQIQFGNFDVVVLQEHSMRPVTDPEVFYSYASVLDSSITATGARTAFYMTWAREWDPPMIEPLALAYNTIGIQLDAEVSPVGRAFQMALEADPTLELYFTDGAHPSTRGTYLAACVIFATLWRVDPVGMNYVNDPTITAAEKLLLQTACWGAVQKYTGAPGETDQLKLAKGAGELAFGWSVTAAECNTPGYAIYAGDLETLHTGGYNHDTPLDCEIPDQSFLLPADDPRLADNSYFLVVPVNAVAEGSYGTGPAGERPPSAAACRPLQNPHACW